jgi:hypothetical protein
MKNIRHSYSGVLSYDSNRELILSNQYGEWKTNDELNAFWKSEQPIYILIETDDNKIFEQYGDEIYLDRESKDRPYTYYINGYDIDSILKRVINNQVYITIDVGKDQRYGKENSKS